MDKLNKIRRCVLDSVDELRDFDWNDLRDIDTIGVWPGVVKFLLAVVLFVACLGAGYWFHIQELQTALAAVQRTEATLRTELEQKAVLAANLDAYRSQMADMEEQFGTLLNQLPGETEVPGLLDDITSTGLASGVEFSLFQPQAEVVREFYLELPINISVTGRYHDFGTFVSGVASLPRIVTLHDFAINAGDNRNELSMSIMARTYRYRTEND